MTTRLDPLNVPLSLHQPPKPTVTREPARYPHWRIVKVRAGRTETGIILCKQLVSVNTHWWCNATVPCLKPYGRECAVCGQVRTAWSGFLPVHSMRTGQLSIFQITPNAADSCPELENPEPLDLLGREIEITRAPSSDRGRMTARLLNTKRRKITEEREVSQERMIRQLFHIWGVQFEVDEKTGAYQSPSQADT